MSYILQFIDSASFMGSPLSNLVDDLSEGIHRIKWKLGLDDEKCGTCIIKYNYCKHFLKSTNFKENLIERKCLFSNKNYEHYFDERLKEQFLNTHKCSNQGNNCFILLLRKGICKKVIWWIYGWLGKI